LAIELGIDPSDALDEGRVGPASPSPAKALAKNM
jgi:hypothetical protein